MSWARVDDGLHGHPKVLRVWRESPAALGLHLLALSYVGAYLTDGAVHRAFVEEKGGVALAAQLVACGLWDADGDGWTIHDYLDFNRSRADVERERKASQQRAKRSRTSRTKKAKAARS